MQRSAVSRVTLMSRHTRLWSIVERHMLSFPRTRSYNSVRSSCSVDEVFKLWSLWNEVAQTFRIASLKQFSTLFAFSLSRSLGSEALGSGSLEKADASKLVEELLQDEDIAQYFDEEFEVSPHCACIKQPSFPWSEKLAVAMLSAMNNARPSASL